MVYAESVPESEALAAELRKVIEAGNALAMAAHHVSAEYDGVHRLRLALADWYMALANQWGRDSESANSHSRPQE